MSSEKDGRSAERSSDRRARKHLSASPNDSYWIEAIETAHVEPPLEGTEEADVVLIGAGYTSLVTAYLLKRRRPDWNVWVLEAEYAGFGASGRNAGMLLQEPHTERLPRDGAEAVRFTYEKTAETVDWIEHVAREEDFDCELERTGYFDIAIHPVHLGRIRTCWKAANEAGVELRVLDAAQIREAIHSDRFLGALLSPRAATLHPGKYVAGLKQAALGAGARLREGSPVVGVRTGTEVEVLTPAGRIRARRLVLGLNAYLPASRLGVVPDRAVSVFSFVLLTEPLSKRHWEAIGWEGRQGYSDLRRLHNYVRLTGERILFGGRVRYHFGLHSPEDLERIYGELHRELLKTFPCLEDVAITHRWCGPVALTWRRTPFIGRTGTAKNIFYALGYSGMGVSLGTLSGQVLADYVLGEERRWEKLLYLEDRSWPLPPEPLRYLGFQGSYFAMRAADALDRFR